MKDPAVLLRFAGVANSAHPIYHCSGSEPGLSLDRLLVPEIALILRD